MRSYERRIHLRTSTLFTVFSLACSAGSTKRVERSKPATSPGAGPSVGPAKVQEHWSGRREDSWGPPDEEHRWSGRREDSWGPSDENSNLDRSMIATAVAKVKPQAIACGAEFAAKGSVRIRITVAPDGHVANASVETAPDPSLGACVATAMKSAVFEKTHRGGSFTYPFTF